MSSFSHAKLVKQVLQEKGISNLRDEPDKVQLEIYTIALFNIRTVVEGYLVGDIPYDTLSNGLELLNELSIVLVPMKLREVEGEFKIGKTLLPVVKSGLKAVNQAVKAYEREKKKRREAKCKKKIYRQHTMKTSYIFGQKL